jgi:hypothetical protein
MGLTLDRASELVSRAARAKVGSTGLRTFIRSKAGKLDTSSGGIGGIIQWVFNAALGFTGWICKIFWDLVSKAVSWTFTALWGAFTSAVSFIWHFNWNQSDEDLDKSLKSAWDSFGGQLGGLAGRAAGSLIVLSGGVALFCFNEALGLHVLRAVGEEALDELISSAVPVLQSIRNLIGRWLFQNAYKSIRDYMGANPDSFYETNAQLVERQIRGEITQAQREEIQKKRDALKAERKPWSFASAFEEWIETFPEGFIRNFVEEFFEEGFEAINELGYIAFSAVDGHIASHRIGAQVASGSNVSAGVQVQLNRNTGTFGAVTP